MLFGILRTVLLIGLVLVTAVSWTETQGGLLEDGTAAAARGEYAAAVGHFSALLIKPDTPGRIQALIGRGEAYRALGLHGEAQIDFSAAVTAAQQAGQPVLEAVARHGLGQVYFIQRDLTRAEQSLSTSLERAEQLELPALAAASANGLGSIRYNQGRKVAAEARYEQALRFAQQAEDAELVAVVRRNRARVARGGKQALTELQAAKEAVATIEWPYVQAVLLLGIAVEARRSIGEGVGVTREDAAKQQSASTFSQDLIEEFVELAYAALQQALTIAEGIDAPRLRSLATGHLGALYEHRKRLTEARILTEQAIQAAQILGAHELLMEWEWQLGRLLQGEGDRARAIDAFRRAVYHLQTIRQDIPIEYHDGRSSFRETLAPIYLGLADLLLQEAEKVNEHKQEQNLLREARDTVERIKVSELRDYLKDPCVVARTEEIEHVSATTAVLYPIIFEDRLELLVNVGERLHRKQMAVSGSELQDTVRFLSQRLREETYVQTAAGDLYDLLVRPIEPVLEKHRVDTLVFVPDGALRALPLSVLWDGERFLVERYAIATAAGLSLLDPRRQERTHVRALFAGLSRPGPVVTKLPEILVDGLLRGRGIGPESRRRGILVTAEQLRSRALNPTALRERGLTENELAEHLKLENVPEEISQLAQRLEGEVLLDDNFLLRRFEQQVASRPYRIVHIASHGFFGGIAEHNFILTYDEKLSMNRLAELLQPKQLAERPVELLGLSACQTAAGDDRTPLGLSGMALKSGARSVLGSLWPIYDEVALRLIPAFYEQLSNPDVTKAQALQRAQLGLLKDADFRDPVFWSPFILVGNWL